VYIVDVPTVGGTFFQFNGDAKINPSLSAGFLVQVGFDRGARSHQVTEIDDDGGAAGDTSVVITLANWYLDHKQLGRITVGRANTATAGITGIDLGGAGVIANVNVGYWNRSFTAIGSGGFNWADLLGGGTVNGSTLSRGNVINYTTPTFGGLSASAAWGENDVWDVALRYAGEHAGFRVAAGIGYSNNASGLGEASSIASDAAPAPNTTAGQEPTMVKGSASILHVGTGLYLSGAYIRQDNDLAGRNDTTLWYVNGGISKNWTGLGNTVLYGEYARVDDGIASSTNTKAGGSAFQNGTPGTSEANVWGIGVVQHIDAAAMEVFLAYRNYSGEATRAAQEPRTLDAEDMQVVMGGARIRF
jgi:predicted porin